jgi:hypothetical protein
VLAAGATAVVLAAGATAVVLAAGATAVVLAAGATAVVSRHELALYMVKSSNALQQFENRDQIVNAIDEVASFSIGG